MDIKKKRLSRAIKSSFILIFWVSILFLGNLFINNMAEEHAKAAQVKENGKTVKIGYIDYENFIDKKDDGTYKGYGVDYLNEIAKHTGWHYEYHYDTFENQMKKLKAGEIDFLCHSQPTKQRRKDYLFSKYSDGIEVSVLYTLPNDDRFYYNDYEHFDGMKIAFLKGSFQNGEFEEYAKLYGFTYKAEYYDTSDECFNKLDQKEVDGVAMGSLAMQSDYKAVCKFGSDPFYFMTGKNNKKLLNELNDAMTAILVDNPYFESKLYSKYYGNSSVNSKVLFTREESEFIKNAEKSKLAFSQTASLFLT